MKRLAVTLLLLAAPVRADETVSPQDFEALSTGKTLHFEMFGEPYGSEQFFANHHTLWKPLLGACEDGQWFAQGNLICFQYGTPEQPVCWHFINRDGTYYARESNEPPNSIYEIELVASDAEPLDCPAPNLGS
jgi:hypothetical protein